MRLAVGGADRRFATPGAVRRGLTLIELVLTMGVGSVIFGLTVLLLALVLRTERTARKHLAETQTIGRLALQFRRDAHAATDAELVAAANTAPAVLRLSANDGSQVEYQAVEGGLRRTRSQSGQSPSREVYVLPSAAATNLDMDNAGPAQIAVLSLESQPGESNGRVGRNLVIEAKIRGATSTRQPASP